MENEKAFRSIPGLSREEEEKQLAEIIGIAQNNLTRTEGCISQLSDELHDLMEAYETKDKELWWRLLQGGFGSESIKGQGRFCF